MTTAKAQAPVEEVVSKALEKLGVPTSAQAATAPDWTKLTEIARELSFVTVHLIRHEKVGFFSKITTQVDAGTYRNIPIETLISGTAEWIYSQAGGGEYTVEIIHPSNPRMGLLTRYKISIPGEPRKAAPLAAQEMQQMLTSRTQVQALASQLMSVQPGMTEAQAFEEAQRAVQSNPLMAQLLVGQQETEDMALPNSNGGMGMVGQIFSMMMLKDVMRENREAAATQTKPSGEDATIKALRDEIQEMRRERERERAEMKAEEARRETDRRMETMQRDFQAKMDAILLKLDKPAPTIDPTAAVLGQILPTFSAQQDQRAAEHARAAESQMVMLKAMMEAGSKRDPALDALLAHMLSTTRLAMEQQQLKLQEPVKQAEAMTSVFGMLGGMMQMTHQIILQQMQAQQGNPFWDRLATIADQLPQIIMGLANPEVDHGTVESAASDTVDERASVSRVQQMRAADQAAQAAVAAPQAPPAVGAPPVEPQLQAPQQVSVEEEEESNLPDDPIERAKIILEIFGLEAAAVLLEKPEAVSDLDLFWHEGAAPSVLGEKLAHMLLGLEIVVDVTGDGLVRAAREHLGWNPQRSGKFAAAFERTIKSASVAPPAAPPVAPPAPVAAA